MNQHHNSDNIGFIFISFCNCWEICRTILYWPPRQKIRRSAKLTKHNRGNSLIHRAWATALRTMWFKGFELIPERIVLLTLTQVCGSTSRHAELIKSCWQQNSAHVWKSQLRTDLKEKTIQLTGISSSSTISKRNQLQELEIGAIVQCCWCDLPTSSNNETRETREFVEHQTLRVLRMDDTCGCEVHPYTFVWATQYIFEFVCVRLLIWWYLDDFQMLPSFDINKTSH